jgi:hypothetical protein
MAETIVLKKQTQSPKKKLSKDAQEEIAEFMESFEDIKHGRIRRVA